MATSIRERFEPRVGEPDEAGCWPWVGHVRSNGYGKFDLKRDGRWSSTTSHRISYELFVGPIPDGYEVDHLCRNRVCCNPDHLEAVTVAENRRRRNEAKTHCNSGHEYTPENTYWWTNPDGYHCRYCRTCRKGHHQS